MSGFPQLGLPAAGAISPTRYIGGTTTGVGPTGGGPYRVGDFVIDINAGVARVVICTVAGSPGTWVASTSGGGAPTGPAGGDLAGNYPNPTLGPVAGAGCRVHRNAPQSIPNAAETDIAWQGVEDWDPYGFHDTATNNNRLTVPAGVGLAGLYLVVLNSFWAANVTNTRQVTIYKNTTAVAIDSRAGANFAAESAVSVLLRLAEGDYVKATCYQDSTAALNYGGNTQTATFSLARLGP